MSYLATDKNRNNGRLEHDVPKQKNLHHSWAGQFNTDGTLRVSDAHGERRYHPYTRIGFEYGVTK